MPENKCDSCVECYKKHSTPSLSKTSCKDYIESIEKKVLNKEKSISLTYTY